jgi:phospholipid/cholesterol/gamma-HCH transport system substrate-binding protein
MENKAHAIIAGIFTIVMAAATVLAAIWFNRDTETRMPYQLATTLSVTGLNPQATVRYRGLEVGRVDDISFDPQKRGQVLVHISVRTDTPVTHSTFATLGYQGVTGLAYVELDDDGSNPAPLPSSKDQVARIEMRPGLLQKLQTEGLAIMMQTEELTRRFNVLLAPENQQAILSALDNMSRAAAALQTLPGQLEPTLARMPAVISEAQRSLAALTRLSRNADALATGLQAPDSAIARLGAAADRVDTLAERFAREVLPLSTDVRSSLRVLNRTLTDLNQRPQSILFGGPAVPPGPGEPGYAAPEAMTMKNTKAGY